MWPQSLLAYAELWVRDVRVPGVSGTSLAEHLRIARATRPVSNQVAPRGLGRPPVHLAADRRGAAKGDVSRWGANLCRLWSHARRLLAASDPSHGQRARTSARPSSCLLRCGNRVTKTVTKGCDSARLTRRQDVAPCHGQPLDSSHTASRHSAAQPASQAGSRRFKSGRPLHPEAPRFVTESRGFLF
jgi:hypothetical protein